MNDKLLQYAINQGPLVVALGVFAFLMVKGFIVTKPAMDTVLASKDEKYREMVAAKDAITEAVQGRVDFRDLQIAERDREIVRERERADEKDQYALRLLEAGKQAAEIAVAALAAKREAEIAAANASRRRSGGD